MVSKTHYQLLINEGKAYYNLSAYMGCTLPSRSSDRIFVDMRCFNEYFEGKVCATLSMGNVLVVRSFDFRGAFLGMSKNVTGFQYVSTTGLVPKGNAHFRVWLETNISTPTTATDPITQACFIDNIALYIFKKD